MSIFSFFSKKKNAMAYFREGIQALKRDRWDDALIALQKAGAANRTGMNNADLGNLLIALSIVNAAAGYIDRAIVGLQFCSTFVTPDSTIGRFIDELMSEIQAENSGMPSPHTVNGRVVPLGFYVSKEVLIAGIQGSIVNTEAVMERVLKGIVTFKKRQKQG